MSDKARTVSDRAVRKASRERLLRDMSYAARWVKLNQREARDADHAKEWTLDDAINTDLTRTQYACLMTAFGQ